MKIQEIEMIYDDSIMKKKWTDNNIGDSGAAIICESLKTNTTLTKLDLRCDEKRSKMKWILLIKKMKEWKNEMMNINDNDNTKERGRNDKW